MSLNNYTNQDGTITFPNLILNNNLEFRNKPAGNSFISIGLSASSVGALNKGDDCISIGNVAGEFSQGDSAVAVGVSSGFVGQGNFSVAVGKNAGGFTQGQNAVAVGNLAGFLNQPENSIALNATGSVLLGQDASNAFYVKPVRNVAGSSLLHYNNVNGEISYSSDVSGDISFNGNVDISGNLNLNCNLLNDVSGINFCDGSYIGSGSSFDISTNEVLHIKSSQNVLISPTSDISLSNTSYGLSVENTNIKTYPTTTGFTALPAYYTNVELGTSQTYITDFNNVYGDYRIYTKSAGTTSDIERLYFTGFAQIFNWTDANTCKQYQSINDTLIYEGKDANNRTTLGFISDTIRLDCPELSKQTIGNIVANDRLIIRALNNDCSYNITNSLSPFLQLLGSGLNVIANITNYSFLENSRFWSCNLTGAGSSATISNMYGLRLNPPTNQTGLTITNNWGIYSGWSSAKNYFAGGVGIGTTNINNALSVEGDVSMNGNVDISGELLLFNTDISGNITTSTANHNADIKATSTGLETTKFLKVKINGADAWVPYFETDPSL